MIIRALLFWEAPAPEIVQHPDARCETVETFIAERLEQAVGWLVTLSGQDRAAVPRS